MKLQNENELDILCTHTNFWIITIIYFKKLVTLGRENKIKVQQEDLKNQTSKKINKTKHTSGKRNFHF